MYLCGGVTVATLLTAFQDFSGHASTVHGVKNRWIAYRHSGEACNKLVWLFLCEAGLGGKCPTRHTVRPLYPWVAGHCPLLHLVFRLLPRAAALIVDRLVPICGRK